MIERYDATHRVGSLRMRRTRGAVTGLLLVLLGAWGALAPFVGPYFHFAYTPDQVWTWIAPRGWLEVLPGVTALVGGLLLIGSGNRATAMLGGWLAVVAGAWFVVGGAFAGTLGIGDVGQPVASTDVKRAVLQMCYFSGLGTLIVFLGGAILARLSVRSAREVRELQAVAASSPAPADAEPAPSPSQAFTQERIPSYRVAERQSGRHLRGFRRHTHA